MRLEELNTIYKENVFVRSLAEFLKGGESKKIFAKGLSGSLDTVIAAALYQKQPKRNFLFILDDREEAAYFQSDLERCLEGEELLFFPLSYKRPYSFEEVDNANVLQRTEVLEKLNNKSGKGKIVVTYPDALGEQVISKRSLVKNSFGLKVGNELDREFISEFLLDYGFEKSDFVYEAGEFAIRGGIIDIYSFGNELPYRIELLGNVIESIRTFDPENQTSVEQKTSVSIIPDLQTKLLEERRDSFLEFIHENTCVWVKNLALSKEVVQRYFERATENIEKVKSHAGDTNLITPVEDLFIDGKRFIQELKSKAVIEAGNTNHFEPDHFYEYDSSMQESFNKDFELLTDAFSEKQSEGYKCILATESLKQYSKLELVVQEHNPEVEVSNLPMSFRSGFVDHEEKLVVYTDHQLFERYFKYKTKGKYSRTKSLTIKELNTLSPGDYVTHIDHGVGRFAGMEKKEVNGKSQEAIRLVYRDNDLLYISIHSLHKISKYSGKDGAAPSMSKLGSPEWENKKKKAKKKIKELAFDLIKLYAKRKKAIGTKYSPDSYLQTEMETSFIYEDTPDQAKATEDVKADMELVNPMDRLVCGDVGFGKTEVAIRAAFKAAVDGKQVAVLVPTTILALQHFKSFSERLEGMPVRIDYLNRFRTTKETKEVLADLKEGKIDILIGTHKIVGKAVEFKDLGLLVIDEEQKFGVGVKDKLKDLKVNVDVLTLTATPIPRTLQFSLMGARDLSVITTPPPNRQPVNTELRNWDEELVRDAIRFELKRGGQVFLIHNRINDIESIGNLVLRLVPDARIGVAHGQMEGKQLEKSMLKFINHDTDVLVSTNIIESGLDIPNANTIIINHAQNYGLSDLHQMRGRVGRSNKKAFCYLLTPSLAGLSQDSRKRLTTLEEFSGLGDGFKIAMRDLDLRGAGDVLGGEQSGYVNDIGYDAYHKILEETVQELKENEFKELFGTIGFDTSVLKRDCILETDLEILIPEDYVTNISERLRLYNEVDNTESEEGLNKLRLSIQDRFGPLPQEVDDLCESVKVRWEAQRLGFEKIALKNGGVKASVTVENNDDYFQSPVFGSVLVYAQTHPRVCSLKEHRGKMLFKLSEVSTIQEAIRVLKEIG